MLDPKALAISRTAGLTDQHAEKIISEAASRMHGMLFGGFHADAVVLAVWLALHEEFDANQDPLDEEEIWERITYACSTIFKG